MKKYIDSCNVRPLGELGARTALLAGRMTDSCYRPENIFTSDVQGWPGDWEGRTILAQALLSRITGYESPYLRANVYALEASFNEKGYLKGIMPEGEFDEQQLSGHGWLLRGLCEYYIYSGDGKALDMAKTIFENLFLPTCGKFDTYPIKLEERVIGGEFAGNIAAVVRGWHISTDTGCAFIPMDGLSQLFELTGDERLGKLLDEMYEKFITIDVVGSKVQTHATLSCARGILRLYGMTGEQKYLDSAKRIFEVYTAEGMTANYANYNWFQRPEWTEPCAIIDSFIVAMRLYEYTDIVEYADMARLIWINGVGRSQRPNGGMGCDTCLGAGANGDYITVRTYEANWCCTMRGGEGMEKAASFGYLIDGDTITVPMMSSSVAVFDVGGGKLRIRQLADSVREGQVEFVVEENTAKQPVTLRVLMPVWAGTADRYAVYTVPCAGESIRVDFNVPEYSDGRRRMKGDHMLGSVNGADELTYICDAYLMSAADVTAAKVRALFD